LRKESIFFHIQLKTILLLIKYCLSLCNFKKICYVVFK